MALTKKSSNKIKKQELEKQIKENKESLIHGRDIVVALLIFAGITQTLVENTDNPSKLAILAPAIALFSGAGFLIKTGIHMWKLDTAQQTLKEITNPHNLKTSQKKKKPVKEIYDARNKSISTYPIR